MRSLARSMFDRAISAADPSLAVRRHLMTHPFPHADGRWIAIAIGKAAPAMLTEALQHLSGPVSALGVTHHENVQAIEGAEIMTAGHPVPDRAGQAAAERIIELLSQAGPDDRVLALISGGGSALVPAPAPGLSLQDKQITSRVLLESGLDINQMNLVRQHLSRLKGGGFLRHAAPAPVTALILSDVIGDDLRAIASGPTVSPLGSRAEALGLLKDAGIFERLPQPVQAHLQQQQDDTPLPEAQNHLVGSNGISLDAMHDGVRGFTPRIVSRSLTGDVADAAGTILEAARQVTEATALIFGGETTVRIRGTGRGGRNQELALRIALAGPDRLDSDWVFLSGGTDGRDGPTDAAGGLVDAGTMDRMVAAGVDAKALLENNDSYAALNAVDDLVITGATGTNVADVQVMLVRPQSV
ncbi:hydroxypyruvate reductase [Sedimentitalea nanhaiensis]|uniref:Hydroxypyruvate reductase n=2 Tax=Sedimentitalea nanhaiensis TaxID=999627 RepID=A0A1I7EB51_9RHOB|nr:hydroxypyruvate reductase [Sedimentitalea nanhaiensis]